MGEFKKYMLLKVSNGGLYLEDIDLKTLPDEQNTAVRKISSNEGVGVLNIKKGDDLSNPVPYTNLSNMLVTLMGGTPVPTKKDKRIGTVLENMSRPEICDEMALNSYIHIDSPIDPDNAFVKVVYGDDGNRYSVLASSVAKCGGEFFKSEKTKPNSNKKNSVTFNVNGKDIKIDGVYDYNLLLRVFDDNCTNPGYKRMIDFISELLGVEDVRKTYTFREACEILHTMSNSFEFQEKVAKFYEEMKSLWNDGGCQNKWFFTLFLYGKNNTGSNTSNNSKGFVTKTYLIERRGINKTKICVNGEIIVPITNEETYNAIMDGKGYCTFLDGGICEIVGIENRPVFNKNGNKYTNYEENWSKIH